MAKAQSGAISFGLVHIPVSLYTATQDDDVRLHQLDKENLALVRYKKTASDGRELSGGDIVKGYEYEKDKYVLVTDDDLESIKTEKDRSIQITQFTDLSAIPVVFYNKPYYVVPEKGGERAFSLLSTAMQEEGKVALGKTVLGTKETMLALLPAENGLLMQTMYYPAQLREFPKDVTYSEPVQAELDMARQLVKALDRPFDPSGYVDDYQERLKNLIENKIEGKEVVAQPSSGGGKVINLMDALKASLERTEKQDDGKQAAHAGRSRSKRAVGA